MRWFFGIFTVVTAVLFLSFVAWITTRVLHADWANYVVGRIMVYDLYAIALIVAYSGFVGLFHLWEKVNGRIDRERETASLEGGDTASRSHPSVRP